MRAGIVTSDEGGPVGLDVGDLALVDACGGAPDGAGLSGVGDAHAVCFVGVGEDVPAENGLERDRIGEEQCKTY